MTRDKCPVCGSADSEIIWQIPFSKLETPLTIAGASLRDYPTVHRWTPATIYDECQHCQSVYQSQLIAPPGHTGRHEIEKMENDEAWRGYRLRWRTILEHTTGRSCMIDAACGVGQYASLAKQAGFERCVSLETNLAYVEWMLTNGMEAHETTLPGLPDDVDLVGKADVLVFSEAFEHMLDAGACMKTLATLVRPGGLLFWSAQAREGYLPIRPAETIYISQEGVDEIHQQCGLRLRQKEFHSGRYWLFSTRAGKDGS